MFKITSNHGFHITFPNGITVSTQFGAGNYGDNYNMSFEVKRDQRQVSSSRAEIAVWDRANTWITSKAPGSDGGDVMGWKTAEEWLAVINWAASYSGQMPVEAETEQGATA